jgi:glycosyltransferase involved in cell wall biosynthesis
LVLDGHDVTLFAADGSETSAHLIPTSEVTLSVLPDRDRRLVEDRHVVNAISAAKDCGIDLLHSHLHVHVLRHAHSVGYPLLTTLHGVAWNQELHSALLEHARRPFVSLSDSERAFLPQLNYVATIPNGVRMDDFPPGPGAGSYLAFVGRIAPEKAPHLAIEAARRSGWQLRMAGPVEAQHRDYANAILKGAGSGVDYLGPMDRSALPRFLGDAAALVMPLAWDEPFGLVVVEALATGTPVVAWDRGAMSEIIVDAVTGYLVADVDEAVRALGNLHDISRADCSQDVRARFSDRAMAAAYAEVYDRLLT